MANTRSILSFLTPRDIAWTYFYTMYSNSVFSHSHLIVSSGLLLCVIIPFLDQIYMTAENLYFALTVLSYVTAAVIEMHVKRKR